MSILALAREARGKHLRTWIRLPWAFLRMLRGKHGEGCTCPDCEEKRTHQGIGDKDFSVLSGKEREALQRGGSLLYLRTQQGTGKEETFKGG